jgi:hypothetical protein
MLHGISYRTSVQCPECMQQVPVNHLRPVMLCSHCQATVDLVARGCAWWQDPRSEEALRFALAQPEGEVESFRSPTNTVEFFRGPADCPTCRRPMLREALVAAASSGSYGCECGFRTSCRAADGFLVERLTWARWMLGEAPPAGAAPNAMQPVVMACMSCGAGLKVDGSSRAVECSFCNASNYLPDGLWLRLHPAPRLEWFRVVIEIEEARFREETTRRDQSDALQRLAARKGVSPEVFVQRLADHMKTTPDVIRKMIRTGKISVDA